MLAQRAVAAPRAEVLVAHASSSSSNGSRSRVGCSPARSRDAQRARAAPATAALTMPSSSATPTTTQVPPSTRPFRGLPPSRGATARRFLTPRATPDSDGADGAAEAGDSDENAGGGDDSSMPPKTTTAANKGGGGAKRAVPALEARKADRLRSQLLSMMPDPVDDPLFDAGAFFFPFFY